MCTNDVATKILETIHSDINKALILDSGYLEFEFIGEKPYLGEKSFTRGSNCTSIDAVMYGQDNNKKKILFLIEWKYTEEYSIENKYILERSSIYDKLILSNNSPFKEIDPKVLYYEPFYQMMRQTLLGCKLKENKDHKCDDYIHVHVIPDENIELRNKITSPGLRGSDISEAWKSTLKNPYKYKTLSPMKLIEPCSNLEDTNSIISYLKRRYW
ncbi:MAG: hypothetical protein KJI69_05905 [Patescibacteria group bacterium]|nr:hypothetical protein [Patescibacteria group bacterium]